MKKFQKCACLLAIAGIAMLFGPLGAYAGSSSGTDSGANNTLGQSIRNEIKNDVSQGGTDIAAIRLQVRERVADAFSSLAADLSQIAGRIMSRAEKMKAGGIDVSAPEALISKAQADITAAEGFAAEIKTKAQAGASLEEIRAIITSLKNSLKEAHGYLVQAVAELKAALNSSQETNINGGLNMGLGSGENSPASGTASQ